MPITVTGGAQIVPRETFGAVDLLTQSTATTEQSISTAFQVTQLGAGTATGFGVNKYVLGLGADGTEKMIVMTATGEAKVRFGGATTNLMATGLHYLGVDTAGVATATGIAGAFLGQATGAFVLTGKGAYLRAMQWDSEWYLLGGQATFASAT